jgi:hypothetical protein
MFGGNFHAFATITDARSGRSLWSIAMIVVWGTTHAGKVDEVPGGMFHVVTRFGHLYYVPLIPMSSFVVLEKTAEGGFRGTQIPLSFKSLLAGWLRAFCVVALIGAGVGLLFTLVDKRSPPLAWVGPVAIGLFASATLVMTYKLAFFTQASYERAKELARHIGLSDVGALMLDVAYGRATPQQAEAELARREQAQQRPANATDRPVEAQVAGF